MGRAVLKNLKQSTLLTYFKICNEWGLKLDKHYKYNSQDNIITFWNGSQTFLKDLFMYPSDPEFDSLGSTEFTGAFIDECSQITTKAKNIVMSRIRHMLDDYDLMPKTFLASNPSKNFLYFDFYKPWKNGTLPKYRKFVPALVQDNPFISPHYLENLKKLDKVSRERLLHGNFEYDDDPAKMFEWDDITRIFEVKDLNRDGMYLSVDVARFGADKCVFVVWEGMFIKKIKSFAKTSTAFVVDKVKDLMHEYDIPIGRVVIDEDGVGGGVVDFLPGCVGFVNNSKAEVDIKKYEDKRQNYANLKSQCYFILSDKVRVGAVGCYSGIDDGIKEMLIEELEQIKKKDIDKDGKLSVIPKDEIKERLGRSTDFSDAVMMRMYFEAKKKQVSFFIG